MNTIHHLSEVQSSDIGKGTTIHQFCVVLINAKIGSNCNICSHVFIENDVVIGNNVTIKNGVKIFDGIHIEDNVFVGPNVTFINDKFPKSRRSDDKKVATYPKTLIKKGASIGGGAIILPGIVVGEGALVGAGAIVSKNVKSNSIVIGNKAHYHRML